MINNHYDVKTGPVKEEVRDRKRKSERECLLRKCQCQGRSRDHLLFVLVYFNFIIIYLYYTHN